MLRVEVQAPGRNPIAQDRFDIVRRSNVDQARHAT
jgi:hypothetical protein